MENNNHESRISALEEDVHQLKNQNTTILAQISNLVGQIQNLSTTFNQSNTNHQKMIAELIFGSEKRIEEKMSPIMDILSGVNWTKRILIAIASAFGTSLLFLANYGHEIADAVAVIRQQLGI